jgi:enoyl-CoA hydratase
MTTLSRDGAGAVWKMDEPRGNALSYATLEVFSRTLDEIAASDARAAVVVGTGRVFCVGLDLRACARFTVDEMRRYVDAFEGFFEKLFDFPLPLVAALNGHAIAGGAVLALACDVRVAAPEAELALNEVELGLPFPSMAFEIGRMGLPPSSHVDGLMLGRRFSSEDALARRIVHARASSSDKVLELAMDRAQELTMRGTHAVTSTKRALRAEALARARAHAPASRAAFVDAFFGKDAQERIRLVVDKLEKKG